MPTCFDLGVLLGRRVRVALLHVASLEAGLTQTLTVTGDDGGLLVIGHAGEVRGIAHRLGKLHVYVALSQRPGGPMVFGTARVQSLVRQGDHVRVRDDGASALRAARSTPDDETFVMQFESRQGTAASYAIGAEELWRGAPSTMR